MGFFLIITTSLLKFDQEGNMYTVWITLTLSLTICHAANRDVRLNVNCSTLLNKHLFHLHLHLWNVSKSNEVFLKVFFLIVLVRFSFNFSKENYTFFVFIYNFSGKLFSNYVWNKMFQWEMLYNNFYGKTWYDIENSSNIL